MLRARVAKPRASCTTAKTRHTHAPKPITAGALVASVAAPIQIAPIGITPPHVTTNSDMIRPRYAIPIHYGTTPQLRGTPAELLSAMGTATAPRILVPEPGQKYAF